MKLFLLLLTCYWCTIISAVAQPDSITGPTCGFGLLQQYQRQHDPLYAQRMRQGEAAIQQRLHSGRGAKVSATTSYIVPVVVHVIHNGEAVGTTNNPSDATIQAMLTNLNNAFQKNGSQFGGVAIGIQFQLAVRSPQCGTTTGIDRVNGSSVPNYTSGGIAVGTYSGSADEVTVKGLSRWPNTDYLNIWIVNKINGSPYIGGFTYFPQYNSAATDGMTLIANTVDGTNKSVVHEMGHYFNLYHSFHDESGRETACPSLTACATTGDFICDTEPVTNVPCNTTLNPCTNAAFQVADASHNYTVQQNYMGYTACSFMFTQNQKDRMLDALLAFREGLLTSDALLPPVAGPPAASCAVSSANGLSAYYGVARLTFNDLDVYSNSSQADGASYVDRTCNQRTTLLRGQTYTLIVEGAYYNTQALRAYLDYNRDGDFNDTGETLLTATSGSATATVGIPASGVVMNVPLRLRIVADNPNGPVPTACNLTGTTTDGAGQVEDYTVMVVPRTVTSVASGSWSTAATWSCNCVPVATDRVTILTGHTVIIGTGLVQASTLSLAGKMQYGSGGRLQLTGK